MNFAIGLLAADLSAFFWPRYNKASDTLGFRRFAYASLLLVNPVGKKAQFVHTLNSPIAPDEIFRWNFGNATGTQPVLISELNIAGTGLYQRTYSNGLIIVNPGTATEVRALGVEMFDVSQNNGGSPPKATSVTLPPSSAVFLLNETAGNLAMVLKAPSVIPHNDTTPTPTDVLGNPVDPIVVLRSVAIVGKQTLSFRNGDLNPCSAGINDSDFRSTMTIDTDTVTSHIAAGQTITAQGSAVAVLEADSVLPDVMGQPVIHSHPARYVPIISKEALYRPILSKEASYDP